MLLYIYIYIYIECFLLLSDQLITLLPQYLGLALPSVFTNLNEIQFAAPQNPTRRDQSDRQTTFSVAGDNTIPYCNLPACVIFPIAAIKDFLFFFFCLRFSSCLLSIPPLLTLPLCPRSSLRTIVAQCHAAKSSSSWTIPARVKALRSVAIDGTTCMPHEKNKVEISELIIAGLKNSLPFESILSRHPPLRGQCQWSPLGNGLAAVRSICSRPFSAG
jgi:hypothetical protein